MNCSRLILTAALNLSLCFSAYAWELEINQEHVSVYSRETESDYIEVKATTSLAGHVGAAVALLFDTDACSNWVSHCRRVQNLSTNSEYDLIVQTFFDAPWPMNDRDMVTHNQLYKYADSETVIITVQDASVSYPVAKRHVRMRAIKGQWTLKANQDATVTITYEGYGEASGSMPVWLANHLAKESIHETFVNLRTQLSKNLTEKNTPTQLSKLSSSE